MYTRNAEHLNYRDEFIRILKIKYANQDKVNQERLSCLVTHKSFRNFLPD